MTETKNDTEQLMDMIQNEILYDPRDDTYVVNGTRYRVRDEKGGMYHVYIFVSGAYIYLGCSVLGTIEKALAWVIMKTMEFVE